MKADLLAISVLGALGGCAPTVSRVSSPSPPPASSAGSGTHAASGPACNALPKTLASYDSISEGVRFSLAIRRDPRGAWAPLEPLEMPLHHASMIDWRGASLLADHGERVIVVATGIGRTSLRQEANTWFATYAARIDEVCPILDGRSASE